jgi:hypothetical protein
MVVIKRNNLISLQQELNSINGDVPVKFGYAVAKNKILLNNEIEIIKGISPKQPEEYETKRTAVIKQYAIKDENEQIIWENEQHGIPKFEDYAKLEQEITSLNLEYKDVLESFNKKINDFEKLLEEDYELPLHTVDIEYAPATMSQTQIDKILIMFK